MKNVRMEKQTVIEILTANKNKHKELFDEAWEAFREKATTNFQAKLDYIKDAEHGDQISLYVNLDQPSDHTDDYERALKMLEYEVESVVTLTQQEFSQLVQDDWGWKDAFASSYTSNTGKFSE